ncbi:uncharacterized protein [Diabrotica undecimpunctata]|uniref:uncharacterized protein n=1 Tax=Diabrotica undecimpunctata TaxID=50387 RepID=UPI003B63F9D8
MKFIYFLFSLVALTALVYANDQEVTVENIAPSLLETEEVLNARAYLPRDCFRPVESDVGMACMALFRVWRWDIKAKACVRDNYGGCNRTKNNFFSLEKCNEVAKPVCENLTEAQLALAH